MNIEVTNGSDETLVKVLGSLDTSVSADFNKAMDEIPSTTKKVKFDFAGLEFIASSALRTMVTLGKRLHARGGVIVVEGANEVVKDVFAMTGLDEVFEIA